MDKYTFFVTIEVKYDVYATNEDSAYEQVKEFIQDDLNADDFVSLNGHIELHSVESTDRR